MGTNYIFNDEYKHPKGKLVINTSENMKQKVCHIDDQDACIISILVPR